MPVVKTIRNRGATITVEAEARLMFAPNGDVGEWTTLFAKRAQAFTKTYAPFNKRPRWGHYGPRLKSTIDSDVAFRPAQMRTYAAVGSSSPHAYYVDQGTGIYAGRGPYVAKILPPWHRNEGSLYESTWKPGGPNGRRVAPVMIKGQKGQDFFNEGLKRTFQSMRMRSYQRPEDPRISKALATVPTGITGFLGNTPADGAFRAELKQWREWRDERFGTGKALGRNGGRYTREARERKSAKALAQVQRGERSQSLAEARAKRSAERSQRYRDEAKRNGKSRKKRSRQDAVRAAMITERGRFLAAARAKYGTRNVLSDTIEFRGGYFYVTIVRSTTGRNRLDEIRGRLVKP